MPRQLPPKAGLGGPVRNASLSLVRPPSEVLPGFLFVCFILWNRSDLGEYNLGLP